MISQSLSQLQRRQWAGRIRYWCADESRVGLFTVQRRKLTGFGIKPIGEVQWEFCYRWLYGAIEPLSGENFLLEFSQLDADCFEVFLEVFSQSYRDELNLIQVDNAMAHIAHSLRVPDNVVLVFQPPYCPEVNPIERLWQELKRELQWCHFESIEALKAAISQWVNQLSTETVQSLTKWGWIIDALCVAGI